MPFGFKIESRRRAPTSNFGIKSFVFANGNVGGGNVGNVQEQIAQIIFHVAEFVVEFGNFFANELFRAVNAFVNSVAIILFPLRATAAPTAAPANAATPAAAAAWTNDKPVVIAIGAAAIANGTTPRPALKLTIKGFM